MSEKISSDKKWACYVDTNDDRFIAKVETVKDYYGFDDATTLFKFLLIKEYRALGFSEKKEGS